MTNTAILFLIRTVTNLVIAMVMPLLFSFSSPYWFTAVMIFVLSVIFGLAFDGVKYQVDCWKKERSQ